MFFIGLALRGDLGAEVGRAGNRKSGSDAVADASHRPVSGILDRVCLRLAEAEQVTFVVSGFGEDPWPVDVRVDLAVFLEQLPDVLDWLDSNRGEVLSLDFYEQGIERFVTITRTTDVVEFACTSYTGWMPNPKTEALSMPAFSDMMAEFVRSFVWCAREYAQREYAREEFRAWRSQTGIRCRLAEAPIGGG